MHALRAVYQNRPVVKWDFNNCEILLTFCKYKLLRKLSTGSLEISSTMSTASIKSKTCSQTTVTCLRCTKSVTKISPDLMCFMHCISLQKLVLLNPCWCQILIWQGQYIYRRTIPRNTCCIQKYTEMNIGQQRHRQRLQEKKITQRFSLRNKHFWNN